MDELPKKLDDFTTLENIGISPTAKQLRWHHIYRNSKLSPSEVQELVETQHKTNIQIEHRHMKMQKSGWEEWYEYRDVDGNLLAQFQLDFSQST